MRSCRNWGLLASAAPWDADYLRFSDVSLCLILSFFWVLGCRSVSKTFASLSSLLKIGSYLLLFLSVFPLPPWRHGCFEHVQ